jgi:hypothetical protein
MLGEPHRTRSNGCLFMLTAYFDDSGTHEQSDIVLMAGVFGTEGRMDSLDRNWKKHLYRPLSGTKPPLRRFHAFDCHNSIGEFQGWIRTETDFFWHQLQTEIIDSGIAAYSIACPRKDYSELITGDMRAIMGDPEGMCINQCFVRAIGWVQANTFDPTMSLVFDDRPSSVRRYVGTVYDAFKRWVQPPPEVTGHAFLSSVDVCPLQVADMIGWELYQHAKDLLVDGLDAPPRQQLKRLIMKMDVQAQIANRDSIVRLRTFWEDRFREKSDLLKQMANHFTFFDPQNPDYSHLSD